MAFSSTYSQVPAARATPSLARAVEMQAYVQATSLPPTSYSRQQSRSAPGLQESGFPSLIRFRRHWKDHPSISRNSSCSVVRRVVSNLHRRSGHGRRDCCRIVAMPRQLADLQQQQLAVRWPHSRLVHPAMILFKSGSLRRLQDVCCSDGLQELPVVILSFNTP